MAGSAASTDCSAVEAAPRSTTCSRAARVSTSPAMPRASAPIRAKWRALPNSRRRCPRYGPSGALQSSSSPPIPRRVRAPAGPGGKSRFPRSQSEPRSLPPAPPMIWREPANGSSADPCPLRVVALHRPEVSSGWKATSCRHSTAKHDPTRTQVPIRLLRDAIPLAHLKTRGAWAAGVHFRSCDARQRRPRERSRPCASCRGSQSRHEGA